MTPTVPTAADLRAELARRQVPIYLLSTAVRMHPSRLGGYLNGSKELPNDLALQLMAAIREFYHHSSAPSPS